MLIGAVVAGLLAIGFVYMAVTGKDAYYQQQLADLRRDLDSANRRPAPQAPAPKVASRPVVYATQRINANTLVEPVLVEIKETPVNLMPGAHERIEDVAGRFASRTIEIGEPLTPTNVSDVRQKMSTRLPIGKRAIALPAISGADASGNFITDGDRVDLLMTYDDPNVGGKRTFTVLQNVRVLYTAGPEKTELTEGITPTKGGGLTSFEVTPEEAEALVNLGEIGGTLYMILRNRDDPTTVKSRGFAVPAFFDSPTSIQRRAEKSREEWEEFNKQREEQEAQENRNEVTPTTPENPAIPNET